MAGNLLVLIGEHVTEIIHTKHPFPGHYSTPDGDRKEEHMNEDAYYDRLLREYDRDVWADLEREAEERLAAGDIACDRWRDDGC